MHENYDDINKKNVFYFYFKLKFFYDISQIYDYFVKAYLWN